MRTTDVAWPAVNCQCMAYAENCICPPVEMALRAWSGGNIEAPMTPEQREYCLAEIGSIEGYSRSDYEQASDRDLARAVLSAWVDYCRDKGML